MKKDLIVKPHIRIDGEYQTWDSLTPEKQKEIGLKLNDKSLRSAGYKPVSDKDGQELAFKKEDTNGYEHR